MVRCVDADDEEENELAERYTRETHVAQEKMDYARIDEVSQHFQLERRTQNYFMHTYSKRVPLVTPVLLCCNSHCFRTRLFSSLVIEVDPCKVSVLVSLSNLQARRKSGQKTSHDSLSESTSSHSSNTSSLEAISDQPWKNDKRLQNPHLRRYFFRQREDSTSTYPSADYRYVRFSCFWPLKNYHCG